MRKHIIIVLAVLIGALVGLWCTRDSLLAGTWLFLQNGLILAGYLRNRTRGHVPREELSRQLTEAQTQIYSLGKEKESLVSRNMAVERLLIEKEKAESDAERRNRLTSRY